MLKSRDLCGADSFLGGAIPRVGKAGDLCQGPFFMYVQYCNEYFWLAGGRNCEHNKVAFRVSAGGVKPMVLAVGVPMSRNHETWGTHGWVVSAQREGRTRSGPPAGQPPRCQTAVEVESFRVCRPLAKCPAHSVAMSGIGICRWVLLELAIFTASFV